MNRLFLYSGFLFILILIFDAYDRDYNQPKTEITESGTIGSINESAKQPPKDSIINKSQIDTANPIQKDVRSIENKKLIINFDAKSGELLFSKLKNYPIKLGATEKVVILDYDKKRYTAASNIQIRDEQSTPIFNVVEISDDSVELSSTNLPKIILTKKIALVEDSHQLVVTNNILNNSNQNIYVRNYEIISRDNNSAASLMLPTYTGSAYYDSENKFSKISFDDMLENEQAIRVQDSWISMIEHYFFSAWLPTRAQTKTVYTNHDNGVFTIGSTSQYDTVGPGQNYEFKSVMFVGPKLQSEISDLANGLDLTVDYGVLTFLSAPLFWILEIIHEVFDNWGISIIVLTILIKAIFFKLSETSYRSMAQMKKLNPRMQALKERYAEDKKKFSEALMRMYKEEKVNPLGGCLPILIQIPVFIALYWVLVESVEMRHAPFVGWIQDLASADPYFILPIAMGVSMYIQQKLNPAPTDATQQKIFLFLPFIFTALFATFPSGLVLYWLTNNILSIAQQYVINKRIVG
uniref:Membrane protein insertase YidC n=1 Tax=uncultured bacterium EIL5A08 TaxID=1768204 RepID=A0A0U2N634_9BACT|nr:putative insertase [uncultured bacterium EIL5A08]